MLIPMKQLAMATCSLESRAGVLASSLTSPRIDRAWAHSRSRSRAAAFWISTPALRLETWRSSAGAICFGIAVGFVLVALVGRAGFFTVSDLTVFRLPLAGFSLISSFAILASSCEVSDSSSAV